MKVDLIDHMGSDLTVVNAARVSFDKTSSQLNHDDIRLIHYLAKHNHWSPFSHAFLQFRVKAPIFVARQLGKHQVGLSWNEVSRRYVDYKPEFYYPDKWRLKAENVKQGSSEETVPDEEAWCDMNSYQDSWDGPADSWPHKYYIRDLCKDAVHLYESLMEYPGVAPEMARMVLPQNMYTEWYWSGSLYAFARVCQLRLDKTSQVEVQQIARQISAHCITKFRHSWTALMKGEIDGKDEA